MARAPMFFSSDKARIELGFQTRPAAEALARAVDWFRVVGR
jgi:nucleoside-diphosphate-sugar epimerase